MIRKILIGAACGLSLAAFASPSLALDTLMLPNAQAASLPNANALTSRSGDMKENENSFHFRVTGQSGMHGSLFAPNAFGPNSDPSNPMGPMKTYGPPPAGSDDPFFHN